MTLYPSDAQCLQILRDENTFPNIIQHCQQVQRVALTIFDALKKPHPVCFPRSCFPISHLPLSPFLSLSLSLSACGTYQPSAHTHTHTHTHTAA